MFFGKTTLVIKTLLFFCLAAIALVSCGNESDGNVTEEKAESTVNITELKEKHPEYFELSDFKGIEVYVWQTAEGVYRCGLSGGTNREKTEDEILALQFASISADEAKAILTELDVSAEDIIVIPTVQPYSDYFYEIDEEYTNTVTELIKGAPEK